MKETVHANIGTQAFTIDKDAYAALKSYFADIACRLEMHDTETLGDIEARIGEIFREKIGGAPMRVVTMEMVREAMVQMGLPADFGERRNRQSGAAGNNTAGQASAGYETTGQTSTAPRKLYRSRTDRSIAGICGGIANYLGIDPTLVRIVTLLLILFGGLSIWVYIILWIVIPEEPILNLNMNHKKQ